MMTILLFVQLLVTISLIVVVLIQRSEGGGLGIGSSQGMGSFMTGRGTTNLLTRATAILASIFMILCITIAVMNKGGGSTKVDSILDQAPQASQSQPKPAAPQSQQTEKTTPDK